MENEKSRAAATEVASEFLTFSLGAEEYAIDILTVQEIRAYDQVTRIAHAPDFIKGVTNLRGVIVPVVDLRLKFGQASVEYTPFTVLIILNVGQRLVGVVVDSVNDVVALTPAQIRPAPDFSSRLDTRYILGLASVAERMLIVTDIGPLMCAREMELMDEVSAQA